MNVDPWSPLRRRGAWQAKLPRSGIETIAYAYWTRPLAADTLAERCLMQPAPTNGNRAEAMEMLFDPAETSSRLLEFFFQIRDPTTLDHQGSDHGSIAMRMWKRLACALAIKWKPT